MVGAGAVLSTDQFRKGLLKIGRRIELEGPLTLPKAA